VPLLHHRTPWVAESVSQVNKYGATLIAISPQLPDNSLATEEKNKLTFPILSDVGNVIARRLGIVFRLSNDLLDAYKAFNHERLVMNGEEGSTELPIPATFVLDKSGTVQFAFVDEDYTKRLDPDTIVDTLRSLQD
jgi:peroxiredoxin